MLNVFRQLFIDARGGNDPRIYSALEKIVKSKREEQYFNFFINRCFYIAINRWQMQSQSQALLPELIGMFEDLGPGLIGGYPTTATLLRRSLKNFTKDELYRKLQRLSRVIDTKSTPSSAEATPVGTLIHRYPYLYDLYLLSEDRKTIRQIKTQLEHRRVFTSLLASILAKQMSLVYGK